MTSLETGIQYGISSQGHFNENKSLIYVKLTDSAQRSIEEYLRNKGQFSERPTIRFQGNEGQIFFPSSKSDHGNFTFSLSSDQDIEGTQGVFECIQKTGPKEMESLGALLCKMRVHANDDIFETTRHRMQAVEVSNKNKCTRVLKSNETVGKKVKVKGTVRKILPPSTTSLSTSPKQRLFSNSPAPPPQPKFPTSKPAANSAGRSHSDAQRKSPDIMRRSLKERLIHLLALRPFKKPELYDRIHQDGLKEQEKKLVATILKQISHMQSNAYHLHASAWNDVQDDWPFYTDDERATLKRRKPQNLTPPGSSDASSSGSGQSPNSMRSDSPPRIIASSVAAINAKRSSYDQASNGFPQKRQRISDYRKPEVNFITSFQEHHPQDHSADLIKCLREKPREREEIQPPNKDSFLNFAEPSVKVEDNNCNSTVCPDYRQVYTTISSSEQKAQYKADFRAYYEDYTKLHSQLSEIAKHFTYLDEELKRKKDSGNEGACKEIELQIVQEYAKTKNIKLRFHYLHEKLGYIKKLVSDWDDKLMKNFQNNGAY